MIDDLWDVFLRFEAWFLGWSTDPTLTSQVAIWALIAGITLLGRPWSRSTRAWFWVATMNGLVWLWLRDHDRLSQGWDQHARLVLIWCLWIAGVWLVITLFGRYVLGWENQTDDAAESTEPGEVLYERRQGPRRQRIGRRRDDRHT